MNEWAFAIIYGFVFSFVFITLYTIFKKGKIILGRIVLLKKEAPTYFYIAYAIISFFMVSLLALITYVLS